jgi:hypothetical protein
MECVKANQQPTTANIYLPNNPANPKILQILIQTNETRFCRDFTTRLFLVEWEGRAKFDSMNESVKMIDKAISKQLKQLRKVIEDEKFKTQATFTLNSKVDKDKLKKLSFAGVYLIELILKKEVVFEKWIEKFKLKWHEKKYEKKFVPNTKKKRIRQHHSNKPYKVIPIYLGRSKNIGKRLIEHLDLKLKRKTTSLKLLERKNMYGLKFRVKTIEIKVANYDVISTVYEKEKRDIINPIIGRQ